MTACKISFKTGFIFHNTHTVINVQFKSKHHICPIKCTFPPWMKYTFQSSKHLSRKSSTNSVKNLKCIHRTVSITAYKLTQIDFKRSKLLKSDQLKAAIDKQRILTQQKTLTQQRKKRWDTLLNASMQAACKKVQIKETDKKPSSFSKPQQRFQALPAIKQTNVKVKYCDEDNWLTTSINQIFKQQSQLVVQ